MGESLMALLGQLFADIIPNIVRPIGAFVKWLVYFGKRKYVDLINEKWNTTLGVLTILLFLFTLMYILTRK